MRKITDEVSTSLTGRYELAVHTFNEAHTAAAHLTTAENWPGYVSNAKATIVGVSDWLTARGPDVLEHIASIRALDTPLSLNLMTALSAQLGNRLIDSLTQSIQRTEHAWNKLGSAFEDVQIEPTESNLQHLGASAGALALAVGSLVDANGKKLSPDKYTIDTPDGRFIDINGTKVPTDKYVIDGEKWPIEGAQMTAYRHGDTVIKVPRDALRTYEDGYLIHEIPYTEEEIRRTFLAYVHYQNQIGQATQGAFPPLKLSKGKILAAEQRHLPGKTFHELSGIEREKHLNGITSHIEQIFHYLNAMPGATPFKRGLVEPNEWPHTNQWLVNDVILRLDFNQSNFRYTMDNKTVLFDSIGVFLINPINRK